ncbi:MAG TPA: TolC family protein [Geobacteraceae bacterium]
MKTTILATLLLLHAASAPAATLTLADALASAAKGNPALRVAAYDPQLAEEDIRLNRSGYLPRVDIQGGYTAQLEPQSITVTSDSTTNSIATQQSDYGFLNLAIYQTLYDFGRTDSRYERAKTNRDAAEFGYRGQEQGTFLQVVTAYFSILQRQKLAQAAEEEVRQMTDHLRVAQSLYEQGVVTRNDLLQAEVRLASSNQRRLDYANRLTNAWLTLNHLTGAAPDYRGELVEETRLGAAQFSAPAPEAIAGRAELKAQRKLLEGNELTVKESKSDFYPELYAKLALDYVENDRVKEQAIMAATVGLKVNIFDGLAGSSRLQQAVINRSRANERLRELEAELALEYRTAVNDALVASQRIGVTEASIRSGEENLRINRDRYEEQVGTATDVIDAQTLLTQIKTEHFQALFDFQVALARVKHARGEL